MAQQGQSGPLPFLSPAKYPDVQPVQKAPPGYQVQRVVLAKRGTTAGTDSFQPPVPTNAIALIGITVNPVTTVPTNYAVLNVQVLDQNASNPSNTVSFAFFRGTKSAWGSTPLDPQLSVINIGISATDASINYIIILYFIVGPPGPAFPSVGFVITGGADTLVTVTFTSAANTALTQDFATIGNVDFIEILAAWFYTSGGTATGNAGFFDGTTRVDFDSTAAVASYVFNTGAKGARTTFAVPGAGTEKVRIVIGAAGVGNTTTLIVVYRAGALR